MDKLVYISLHTTVESGHLRTEEPEYSLQFCFQRKNRTRWFPKAIWAHIGFYSLHRLLSALENVPVVRTYSNIRLSKDSYFIYPRSILTSAVWYAFDAEGWEMWERWYDYMDVPRELGDIPNKEELVRLENGQVVKQKDI